jgi:hypothetical protein
VPDDFVIARNPDEDSTLPYLLRVPLGARGVILKARETWPRTAKVYCHRVEEWPDDAQVIERVPVRSCVRRGAAIDLVLDRGRENRSQLVFTRVRGGRQVIFWQTARTSKQARPAVSVPSARAFGVAGLEIVVDSRERYAYKFPDQQVSLSRGPLTAGDYGVVTDGTLVASVERKSLADLVSSLTQGKLKYQIGELAALPRAAVVVEDRYSAVYRLKRVRPSVVADGLAECQVRWPSVPIVFAETRKLAQEWTYRFLAAAYTGLVEERGGAELAEALVAGPPLEDVAEVRRLNAGSLAGPSPAKVRAWALANGYRVSDRGRIKREVMEAFLAAGGD